MRSRQAQGFLRAEQLALTPERLGGGSGRGCQPGIVPHPKSTEEFPSGHQCQSVGRACQSHSLGTDFEAQFWPSREEYHSLLAVSSRAPWGQRWCVLHISNLNVSQEINRKKTIPGGDLAWAEAWRQARACHERQKAWTRKEKDGGPGAMFRGHMAKGLGCQGKELGL